MTFTAVGGIIQADTASLSLSPAGGGDLILYQVVVPHDGTVHCTGISGGGVTWAQMGTVYTGTVNNATAVVFAGTVTATGPGTATLSFSGSPPAIRSAGQEFSSTAGSWALDVQGGLDSSGTASMPSLTPAASGELYFGYDYDASSADAGSTAGYTYLDDAHSNGLVYNPACTSSAQAPAWASSSCLFGLAVLVRETPPAVRSGLLMAGII